MIQLGNKVKDKVSGFEGIAVSRHEYLNGCVRISVQAKMGKDGKHPDELNFDIGQLDLISAGITKEIKPKATGGPTDSRTQKSLRN